MKLIEWFKNTASLERIDYAFTDYIAGKPVYYYRDKDGVVWMKTSKWSLFRCRSSHGGEDRQNYTLSVIMNQHDGI